MSQPEVTVFPRRMNEAPPNALGIPDFGEVASIADGFARRVPWYVWAGVGIYLGWKLSQRKSG